MSIGELDVSCVEKPTAIFWDIESVKGIKCKSPAKVQKLIDSVRSDLIASKQLNEVKFNCVFAKAISGKQTSVLVKNSIHIERVKFVKKGDDAADLKLIELIDEFVSVYKDKSVIVLISGDGDFIKRLVKHKDNHKITVYTVHREASFSYLLDAVADETFMTTSDGLVSITDRVNVVAVKITGIPDNLHENMVKATLGETFGYIGGSREAIYFDCDRNCYWINFECAEMARLVVKTKNNLGLFNVSIVIKYDKNPPEDVVKRLLELDVEESVRKRKMNIIRSAIDHERDIKGWRVEKVPIFSFKCYNMKPCFLVSGIPGNIGGVEHFFKKYFGISNEKIWQNDRSVAFNRKRDDHEMIKIIERLNRSNIHPGLKLKATLFSIPKNLQEV